MLDQVHIRQTLRKKGFQYTIYMISVHLIAPLAGLAFAIYDRFIIYNRQDVAVSIRSTVPDSDTYSLIDELAVDDQERILHIISHEKVDDSQLKLWDVPISFSKPHTLSFFRSLGNSQVILCKSDAHLKWYRWFDTSDRQYIRLYHGPITKAYKTNNSVSLSQTLSENLPLIKLTPQFRSVGSDVERYFRASSERRQPDKYPKWGYPRFNRVRKFVAGEAEPVVPAKVEEILSDSTYTNVLYAPTHKDGEYSTTFFPFPDFNPDQLQDLCQEYNLRIFLRPHPSDHPEYEHLVDENTIYFADQSFANSVTEILPYMDGLITDYSSIYIEYLLFDRNIIFVKDKHKKFKQIRGLAFDYEHYFPGPKPETFDEFVDLLSDIGEGTDDGFSKERQFVRKTFMPPTEYRFLETVFSECSTDRYTGGRND